MKRRTWLWVSVLLLAMAAGVVHSLTKDLCVGTWWKYDLRLPVCPVGRMRQTLSLGAEGLRRGAAGTVVVGAGVRYTTRDADDELRAGVRDFEATLLLVDAAGKETPLAPAKGWQRAGADPRKHGAVTLPEVPDGDYLLRARVTSKLGAGTLDLPVPLYSPARVHVITDRPLYEPGNVVRFRAVVLRARDLAPLDGRPGLWTVRDPSGEILLEEKAPAKDWGVVAGSFPLDKGAPTGAWQVSWSSGGAADTVSFTVEPFTLPRFRVEATPGKPFYQAGEAPVLAGAVTYSSGAPVPGAAVEVSWQIGGDWPPPTDWLEKTLPRQATAGPNGRFELALPAVPADLQGQVTLHARLSAVDPAGDRVEGGAAVLLSEDGIAVSAVSELADGLVQGFNNRLYLRVASADGRVLPRAKLHVTRAWQADDPGVDTETDEDGVASLQVDPGPPVNIVIPPPPVRPPPRQPVVSLAEVRELVSDQESLGDRVAIESWLAALEQCAKWETGGETVQVGLRVDAGGAVVAAAADDEPLATCVAAVLRGRRLPAGRERLYAISFQFGDADLPSLAASIEGAFDPPEGLSERFERAALGARDCLPDGRDGALPQAIVWRTTAGQKDVTIGWIQDPDGDAATAGALACLKGRLGRIALDEEAGRDDLGLARFQLSPAPRYTVGRAQATVMLGYEMAVAAEVDGKPAGKTRLRMAPGAVPPVRLRATPVLAQVGGEVKVEILRGPEFRGELPDELTLDHLKGHLVAKVDKESRSATFELDDKAQGWCEIAGLGARALVYVRPPGELTVTLAPGQARYAPGDTAHIKIETRLGGQGGQAAVGLFGVDDSLAQLAPLPGPDDMGRLRPQASVSAPAFGVLDGQALALGRIRGANAAAATILRVTSLPAAPEMEATVSVSAESPFDPIAELTDRFYVVLAELHAQARAWEAGAPAGEKMTPRAMAALWDKALGACAKRGERVDDAYGRRLRLSRLPADLLELTDPRLVVVVGTRLPEDVENWPAWVAKERP